MSASTNGTWYMHWLQELNNALPVSAQCGRRANKKGGTKRTNHTHDSNTLLNLVKQDIFSYHSLASTQGSLLRSIRSQIVHNSVTL